MLQFGPLNLDFISLMSIEPLSFTMSIIHVFKYSLEHCMIVKGLIRLIDLKCLYDSSPDEGEYVQHGSPMSFLPTANDWSLWSMGCGVHKENTVDMYPFFLGQLHLDVLFFLQMSCSQESVFGIKKKGTSLFIITNWH